MWHLFVDRGGTFTDVVARAPDGTLSVRKLLSRCESYVDATEVVADGLTVAELRLGTTVATNALLERAGEPVLLLTTRGFADLPLIGSQERSELFALRILPRRPLHVAVVELDERVLADGSVRTAPDEDSIRRALTGFDSVAVVLCNAWVNPSHELLVERVARAAGVRHVTLSHRVSPGIGLLARLDTTIADAYLTPGLRASVARASAPGARVLCMQSSGGLCAPDTFSGRNAILSGPAGGVVATRHVARQAGFVQVIGFDMGGTSTDVCRCGETLERVHETVVDGLRIRSPSLDIETVAAGGGSVLALVDGRMTVGPRSAGADPGPACYGRGGPATVTDANVVLGRIRVADFPHMTLDVAAARARLSAFGDPREAARGFVEVADESMAAAIRRVSVARGHDVREHALVCFGGAGGQHCCAVARKLGIRTVLVHPLAGVLSAYGLGLADLQSHAVLPLADAAGRPPRDPPADFEPPFPDEQAEAGVRAQGARTIDLLRSIDVRYVGASDVLEVPWTADWRARFEDLHARRLGLRRPGHALEVLAARVDAVGRIERLDDSELPCIPHRPEPALVEDGFAVFRRAGLGPGAEIDGPALLTEDASTTWLAEGWRARVDGRRVLVLTDVSEREVATDASTARDPVTLEVMSNRFMSIAEQMGEQLRRLAHSTNVKERRDFSCAVFDARGELVANAPHIPVHLGAMGETVRHLLARHALRDGDAWLSNDPYHGGSHLPDLTVVTPVFREGRLAFLVANRGHHADVGGTTPGSMPPDSRTLADEGALLCDVLLLRDGVLHEDVVAATLRAAGTRDVPERLADLRAQIACNRTGAELLDALCCVHGTGYVSAWMGHVQDNAEEAMREVVSRLRDGDFEDVLDGGARIRVSIRVRDGRARIDFSGTSPQQPDNRNAPRAVTIACVLYVFRTLAARSVPLNAGCLRPLDVIVPEGSLLDPRAPAAVVGGNVETSQRVVDVLYGALGVLAASQGTMNNLTFGDEAFGYYETLGGGAGAGFGFDGASAVQVHMTNTRATDPEVLEQRCPVVVRRTAVRRGSGGRGVWKGGDGLVRELEFLRPLSVALLAERRTTAPFGVRAGSGAPGRDELSPNHVVVRTPGGGGYSPSPEQWAGMSPDLARLVFREDRWHGTTRGIATGFVQAELVVVDVDQADAVEARLRRAGRVTHRGTPGDSRLHDRFGDADLSTDLPGYRVGEERPRVLPFGPRDVALLWTPAVADAPPPIDVPWSGGAPGCRFVTDQPVG